jgi:hypothetical protein
LRALLVGLLALVLVTQAAAAAMQVQTPATRKANVQRAVTLDEQLERKLHALRKHRVAIQFFDTHRRLLASAESRAVAQSARTHAQRRVLQLTRIVTVLRAKVRQRDARRLKALPPRAAICRVFGSHCQDALAVAWCESRLRTTAQNGQYLGLFQLGSHERSLFGHGGSAHDQATAARRYFVRSGRDWSPWSCRWAAT